MNHRLLPQSKKLINEMLKAGYDYCLQKGDWSGHHRRHCNACIEQYKRHKKIEKYEKKKNK